jgi:hypothetical protein
MGIIPSDWHQRKQFSSLDCHHEPMITSELDKENFVQEMVHGYSKGQVLPLFLYRYMYNLALHDPQLYRMQYTGLFLF